MQATKVLARRTCFGVHSDMCQASNWLALAPLFAASPSRAFATGSGIVMLSG